MSNISAFDAFTSVEVKSRVFGKGVHEAVLSTVSFSDSFTAADGSAKDIHPEWSKPTPQVIVFFKNDSGNAIMRRYNMLGYDKRDDIADEEWATGKYAISAEGFLILDGERIVNKEKTAACHRILSELFDAVGLPAGSGLNDLVAKVDDKPKVLITVEEGETTNGNKSFEVTKVKKFKVAVDVGDEAL